VLYKLHLTLKFDGIMIYCVMGHCGAFWVYRRVYSSLWNMFCVVWFNTCSLNV